MKIINIIATTIVLLFVIATPASAWEEASPESCRGRYTCASVNVSLNDISNWPGGEVEVRCKGGQDAGLARPCCIGESATLSPGQTVTLNKCDCEVGKGNCVEITGKNGEANSCDVDVAGGACGGTNGKSEITDAYLTGSCPAPSSGNPPGGENPPGGGNPPGGSNPNPGGGNPGGGNPGGSPGEQPEETPAPGGEQCECTYEEQCIENGEEGTRTCNGVNTENGCGFGNSCTANCTECRIPQKPGQTPGPASTPPPPINRCDQPCEDDSYCAETTTDNCTKCLPSGSGKTCQPPPGQTPGPKITPRPTVRPTPTPLAYSPAMCKCDGIEPSLIVPGLTSKITAKAYVGGADTKAAQIKDVVFTLVEGNSTVGTVLQKSNKIPAAVTSTTAGRVNYAATWDVNIPNTLKQGSLYRIFATINCGRKQVTALNMLNTAVLAAETQAPEDEGVFAGVGNWLQTIFGIRPKSAPTPGPISEDQLKSSAGTGSTPVPKASIDNNEELKLRTVQPATLLTRGCTSITFQAK